MQRSAPDASRRLRRALVGVSMLAALLVLAIVGILVHWERRLLSASGDPFTRGPDFGLLRVDAGPRRVAYAFVDTAGRVRDRVVEPARSGA